MTTKEVADRLVSLCREGKIPEAIEELFSENAVSIEPNDSMGPRKQEGLDAIRKKSEYFNSMVEEFHGSKISEPLIGGKYFSISWWLDSTMKGRGRMEMEEICVYKVEDGKIVSEEFFF